MVCCRGRGCVYRCITWCQYFLSSCLLPYHILCSVVVTRPLALKYLNRTVRKTNADAVIGKTARVVYPVNNVKGTGRVLVAHMEWAAKSSDDLTVFKRDDLAVVERIEGVFLVIKKLDINGKEDKESCGEKS